MGCACSQGGPAFLPVVEQVWYFVPFVRGENPALEGKGVTQSSRVCTVNCSSVEKSQAQYKCVLILKVSSAR